MKKPKTVILHPFLLAAYPVLVLLANNLDQVTWGAAVRPLLISVVASLLVYQALKFLLGEAHKAALLTSFGLVWFFSYGHIYNLVEQSAIWGIALGRHRLLLPLWLALAGFGLWWIWRQQREFAPLTRALNGMVAIALLLPALQIGYHYLQSQRLSQKRTAAEEAWGNLRLPQGQTPPDIYYIILDGYSRDDMLQKFYHLDNTAFLEGLERLGFYVARCAQSNYAQTQLSLASSLNGAYLDALGEGYTPGNTSRAGLAELIQRSAVRQALEGLGYRTFAFDSGYEATRLRDADVYLSPHVRYEINDFENLLVRTTAARLLSEGVAFLNLPPDWEARDQAHRERILFTLKELERMPDLQGPKFVFAHIVAPHWPHVFDANGQPVHERPDSVTGYRNQVIFINNQILPLVTDLIKNSRVAPLIILQGDHGAIPEDPERRMSILNAYFLPGGGERLLYEAISPVNTFRLVFNYYFGGEAPFLTDVSYYSPYDDPYRFQIIPNTRRGCSGGVLP